MSVTFSIQVSLQVFKALTARLEEGLTHDDIIRDLLRLDSPVEPEGRNAVSDVSAIFQDKLGEVLHEQSGRGGFFSRGLWLPNGTRLRARYKQQEYLAEIRNNSWSDEEGRQQSSPSAAATAITGTNVNGLRFWEARRPTDTIWRRLDALVES
jgi:hypothetical protein